MKKYFKTLDQQIEILKNRGLTIDDVEKAKEVLLHYNYYKVINGTIMFFNRKDDAYRYEENTSFDEILATHEFDKDLKKILLASILDIERHLRSIISYIFMEHHPDQDAYLRKENFNNNDNLIEANIYSIEKTIENYREEANYNKTMKYYTDKYSHIPLWFIINFISFGKLVNFYQTMKDKEAYKVANDFTKFMTDNLPSAKGYYLTQNQFESIIENIKELRNLCAHDNLLLNYIADEEVDHIAPIHEHYNLDRDKPRKDLFNIYIVMQILLSKEQFDLLTRQIKEKIEDLSKKINDKSFSRVLASIGFDQDFISN